MATRYGSSPYAGWTENEPCAPAGRYVSSPCAGVTSRASSGWGRVARRRCQYVGPMTALGMSLQGDRSSHRQGCSSMTPSDLQTFIAERRWTRKRFGEEMEISQDRLRRWLSGDQPNPRQIALACGAIPYGLPPYGSTEGGAPTDHCDPLEADRPSHWARPDKDDQ